MLKLHIITKIVRDYVFIGDNVTSLEGNVTEENQLFQKWETKPLHGKLLGYLK